MKKNLSRDFHTKIDLFETLINIIAVYVNEILDELPTFADMDDLKSSGDVERLRRIVSGLLLNEGLERLYAARRILLCGYQGRMLACLRDMWEAIYYSDICLQSQILAQKWLNAEYLPRPQDLPKGVVVNDIVKKYREGRRWSDLSTFGVHPTRLTRERSILYGLPVSRSLLTIDTFKNLEVRELEKRQSFINVWIAITTVRDFLEYLHSTYPYVYNRNVSLSSAMNKFKKRFWINLVILRKQLREKFPKEHSSM